MKALSYNLFLGAAGSCQELELFGTIDYTREHLRKTPGRLLARPVCPVALPSFCTILNTLFVLSQEITSRKLLHFGTTLY